MTAKPYPEVPHLHISLNASRDGDSTTALGSLFQRLTNRHSNSLNSNEVEMSYS